MDLLDEVGLRRSVFGFGKIYEMLVKEFIVNIPEYCDIPSSKEYLKVFVRGKCVEFSPEVINRYLGRNEEACAEVEVTDKIVCKKIKAK